jgi:ribosome-associated toxin RatA of RatAB toxin-antitoxin module
MSYSAIIPVEFPYPRPKVYEALCDLGSYPQWNSGMISISHLGRMQVGLEYTTKSSVLGKINKSTVRVVEMIPDESIVLDSLAGLIKFRATFQLRELTPGSCALTCSLKFEFSQAVFDLARPVIESIAETRIRTDLEVLRSSLL